MTLRKEDMRYHPLTSDDRAAMLAKIGAPDIDALFRDVPKSAVVPLSVFDLPDVIQTTEYYKRKNLQQYSFATRLYNRLKTYAGMR